MQPCEGEVVPADCRAGESAGAHRRIVFYTPGFRRYRTSDYDRQDTEEFVSISVTGEKCALHCEHCKTHALQGMVDLPASGRTLYALCADLADRGTRGILVSGGSDRSGRVPLMRHLPDLARVRRELGLTVHVHPGLPDVGTCDALADIGIDAALFDVIGDRETIRSVYHLDAGPEEYEAVLASFARRGVPAVPHIVIGHYFGSMKGEWRALEMVRRHPAKALVVVILTPWEDNGGDHQTGPALPEIEQFFLAARASCPDIPLILGCARPRGGLRAAIDRMAIEAGFDGIAFPADGMVAHAGHAGLTPRFVNGCCTVPW